MWTTTERKKAFDKLFKEKIVPFLNAHVFEQHTKTSKRMFKDFGNQLSVFIFFEFKTFGGGFYDISIAYFDEEIGDVYNDNYLALAKIKKPTLRGENETELNHSAELWKEDMQTRILLFIEKYSTHKAILEAEDSSFYYSPARKEQVIKLLERKSKLAKD